MGLDHGRIETRICSCLTDFKFISPDNRWTNFNMIIRIKSTREFKKN